MSSYLQMAKLNCIQTSERKGSKSQQDPTLLLSTFICKPLVCFTNLKLGINPSTLSMLRKYFY